MATQGTARKRKRNKLLVDNDDESIVRRTMGRRICPRCKRVFHLEHRPPRDGRLCPEDGTEVVQRSDDTEERIRRRLREYHEKVVPTLDYLRGLGLPVAVVPGNLPVFTEQAVRASVLDAIRPRAFRPVKTDPQPDPVIASRGVPGRSLSLFEKLWRGFITPIASLRTVRSRVGPP